MCDGKKQSRSHNCLFGCYWILDGPLSLQICHPSGVRSRSMNRTLFLGYSAWGLSLDAWVFLVLPSILCCWLYFCEVRRLSFGSSMFDSVCKQLDLHLNNLVPDFPWLLFFVLIPFKLHHIYLITGVVDKWYCVSMFCFFVFYQREWAKSFTLRWFEVLCLVVRCLISRRLFNADN